MPMYTTSRSSSSARGRSYTSIIPPLTIPGFYLIQHAQRRVRNSNSIVPGQVDLHQSKVILQHLGVFLHTSGPVGGDAAAVVLVYTSDARGQRHGVEVVGELGVELV